MIITEEHKLYYYDYVTHLTTMGAGSIVRTRTCAELVSEVNSLTQGKVYASSDTLQSETLP